jgi:hypothetical protein
MPAAWVRPYPFLDIAPDGEFGFGSLGDFPLHQEKRPLPRAKQSSYVGFFG